MSSQKQNIKLIIMDVDGVLTDGKIILGSDGMEYKNFNVKDGMGITIAQHSGIKFAIITGRQSPIVTYRAKELKIDFVYQGIQDKKAILRELMQSLNLSLCEIAFVGDDLNDLPILKEVGHSFAPKDATELVKGQVDVVTESKGGEGVVREILEIIMNDQGNYLKIVETYLEEKYKVNQ